MAAWAVSGCLGCPAIPSSALICGLVFLVPMLHRLLGLREDTPGHVEATLGQAVEANGPRQHYMRATSQWEAGERRVTALPAQDSSLHGGLRPRRLPDRQAARRPGASQGRAGDHHPA